MSPVVSAPAYAAPALASFPDVWAWLVAFRLWLEAWQAFTGGNCYDRRLPFEARRALGTAICGRCQRASLGAFGCTAGC